METDEGDIAGDERLLLEVSEPAVGRQNEALGTREVIGKRLSARKMSQVISNFAKPRAESFKMHLFLFSIIKQKIFHLK